VCICYFISTGERSFIGTELTYAFAHLFSTRHLSQDLFTSIFFLKKIHHIHIELDVCMQL
jgi:hypothetical protein